MIPVDRDILVAIAPRVSGRKAEAQANIINSIGDSLASVLEHYEINTRSRVAHFLAQVAHESDGFCTTEEYASGAAYEGRRDLGNTQPGDGRRFKGRGLIQLTGRANYHTLGGKLGVDLENNPEMAAEPKLSLRVACEYWKGRKLNQAADGDDLIDATRRVNGGQNGLDARRAYLVKAKAALARLEAGGVARDPSADHPVLRRGSRGPEVAELQTRLRASGLPVGVDGDFGPATELAVMRFQADKRLTADGIVGPATWAALLKGK
ncbi:peptidoglycan-binding protein [Inquilinus sp. CA228]|uniref:peptidoglycan-binding protein n=1 Tax=Inquilinus sp. CA228 TaxID=3455609 RepID=UPI003F8D23AB